MSLTNQQILVASPGRRESRSFLRFLWLFVLMAVLLLGYLLWKRPFPLFMGKGKPTVVLYCSQDQVYAEPILAAFTKATGIEVRPVFDSESLKTVAIANRLLAEKTHPQCDVYWGNEELRTRQLAAQDIFRETNGWAAVGYRSRRLALNTNLVPSASAPRSLVELTNKVWDRKVALAYPLFGTTATHMLTLRQRWGEQRWLAWCRALQANHPFLVEGNSVVVQFVARGEALVGLTDSDDIAAGQREGMPVAALPLTEESLFIPNTLALIREAPHPDAAQRLFEYLQQRTVVERLVAAHALESADSPPRSSPTLQPDWEMVLRDLVPVSDTLKRIFIR